MIDFAASLIVYLRPRLDAPTTVGAKVPGPPRGQFVLVRRIGGPLDHPVIDQPTIEISAWAATQALAHDICQEARGHTFKLDPRRPGGIGMLAGTPIYRVDEFSGPRWDPDPDSEEPRFTTTLSIRHREHLEVT
jgi:hypothetical protein